MKYLTVQGSIQPILGTSVHQTHLLLIKRFSVTQGLVKTFSESLFFPSVFSIPYLKKRLFL